MRKAIPLLFCALAMLSWGSASAAPNAGKVLAMGGQSFIVAHGHRTALKLGAAVHAGDRVVVSKGGRLKLRMADGSIIAAGSGSHLTIDKYKVGGGTRDAELSLTQGILRAIVSAFGASQHFEVSTATGVAAVRSTDWFIEAKPDATQVGVLHGVVTLTSAATHRSVRIPARWGARVEAGRDPVPPRVWSEAEFADVVARTNVP
jgi:hypothetical protein